MIDALYISASGLRSQQEQIDVISNNVANMQTPGFKKSRISFAEIARVGAAGAMPQMLGGEGGGTRIQATLPVFSEGEIRPTRNATDLAIDGAGFFELETTLGERVYTRAGQFRIDADGYLVSVSGLRLAQGIRIPQDATELHISDTGEITAKLGSDTERTALDVLELASFASPDALRAIGDNNFAPSDASGAASFGRAGDPGFGRLQQGYVEMANVDLIDEMASLVMAQRAYQLNARVLQASDQVLETINNLRR